MHNSHIDRINKHKHFYILKTNGCDSSNLKQNYKSMWGLYQRGSCNLIQKFSDLYMEAQRKIFKLFHHKYYMLALKGPSLSMKIHQKKHDESGL